MMAVSGCLKISIRFALWRPVRTRVHVQRQIRESTQTSRKQVPLIESYTEGLQTEPLFLRCWKPLPVDLRLPKPAIAEIWNSPLFDLLSPLLKFRFLAERLAQFKVL